jgi:hypothetical protein
VCEMTIMEEKQVAEQATVLLELVELLANEHSSLLGRLRFLRARWARWAERVFTLSDSRAKPQCPKILHGAHYLGQLVNTCDLCQAVDGLLGKHHTVGMEKAGAELAEVGGQAVVLKELVEELAEMVVEAGRRERRARESAEAEADRVIEMRTRENDLLTGLWKAVGPVPPHSHTLREAVIICADVARDAREMRELWKMLGSVSFHGGGIPSAEQVAAEARMRVLLEGRSAAPRWGLVPREGVATVLRQLEKIPLDKKTVGEAEASLMLRELLGEG